MAKDKKKKKHHPVRNFFITLFIVLLVITLPIGALFLLIYDKTDNTRVYESTNITELGSRALVQGIRNASENKKITVEVTKDEFNGIIVDLTSSLNVPQIKKVYCLKQDGHANFYMQLEAGPMKTLLKLVTSVVSEGDEVIMNIDNVVVGKLKVSKGFTTNILKTFKVSLPETSENGLLIDLKNWRIVISKSILLDSINNGQGLVGDVFNIIQDNELLSYDASGSNTILAVDINIDKLQNNPLLTNDDEHMFTNRPSSVYSQIGADQVVSEIDSKVSYILNHADIKSEHVEHLFKFLFKGYATSTAEEKAVIDEIYAQYPTIFEEVGIPYIPEYHSYGDVLASNSGNLLGNAEAQINFTDLSNADVASISESDMNNYIKGKGVIGYTGIVDYSVNGIAKDYAFFVIDNFYCNIVDDHMYFVCGLNVNGFPTNIVVTMEKDDSQPDKSKAYFRLAKVEFGEIDGEKLVDSVFSIISDGLEGDTMVGVDKDHKLIYFNLQPVVDKVKEFDEYKDKQASDIELSAIGADLAADGQLKLSIH